MTAAWGDPVAVELSALPKTLAWFDPAKQIRVTAEATTWARYIKRGSLKQEKVAGYHVFVRRYLPIADLLGPKGLLAKPLVGKTLAELRESYSDRLIVESKAQMREKRDRLLSDDKEAKKTAKQMDDMVAAAGITNDINVKLNLPPFETSPHAGYSRFEWKDSKVDRFTVNFEHGGDDQLAQEILAHVAAAYGKPIAAKQDGDLCEHPKCDEYEFAGPRGTVAILKAGSMDDDWRLTIRRK